MTSQTSVVKANDETVYYSGNYWNDYGYIRGEINKRITGAATKEWYEYFFESQGKKKFKKALILNCGNGWVEREIYPLGLFEQAVGVDYSDKLLKAAKKAADRLPIRYYKMDINTAKFPESGFDLVINHAAGHHIAYINKVFYVLSNIMTTDGLLVSYDYVGPHRNQYPIDQWAAAQEVNRKLPPDLRQDMKYPHLPTMLVTDPSEAVHSELILETCKMYFSIIESKSAGGPIAYLILTHNPNAKSFLSKKNKKWLEFVMQKDLEYINSHHGSSMFDYWVAQPNKKAHKKDFLLRRQKEEDIREASAKDNKGTYYDNNFLQDLYLEREDLILKNSHLIADINKQSKVGGNENKERVLFHIRRAKRAAKRLIK